MFEGDSRLVGRRRLSPTKLLALLLPLCLACSAFLTAAVSSAGPGPAPGAVARVDTAISLSTPSRLVPFGYELTVEANVFHEGSSTLEAGGSVRFMIDGSASGRQVPVRDGIASRTLRGLSPGEHSVTAVFLGSRQASASRSTFTVSVDSSPPQPAGILPCASRKVVLTNAYRRGATLRFEGVARYSLRGETVRVRSGGKVVASAEVLSDGTWWASAPDRARVFPGKTKFTASTSGGRSWPRRLGQAIAVASRMPAGAARSGSMPRVEASLGIRGIRGVVGVVLARQQGCRKQKAVPIRQLASSSLGRARIQMPRPAKGEPYAIYRLRALNGTVVSPPIIVRAAD